MSRLSPFPWKRGARLKADAIFDADGQYVAIVHGANCGGRYPKSDPNARSRHERAMANRALLAASPDLLSCVEGLLANFPELGTDKPLSGADVIDWLNDQAPYWRAAVKKARSRG